MQLLSPVASLLPPNTSVRRQEEGDRRHTYGFHSCLLIPVSSHEHVEAGCILGFNPRHDDSSARSTVCLLLSFVRNKRKKQRKIRGCRKIPAKISRRLAADANSSRSSCVGSVLKQASALCSPLADFVS